MNARRNLALAICLAAVMALGYQLQHRYGIREPAKAYGASLAAVVLLVKVPIWVTIAAGAAAAAGLYAGVI